MQPGGFKCSHGISPSPPGRGRRVQVQDSENVSRERGSNSQVGPMLAQLPQMRDAPHPPPGRVGRRAPTTPHLQFLLCLQVLPCMNA